MTDNDRKIDLSNILHSYVELMDLEAIKCILKMDNNPMTTVEDYIIALHDGLRYGNWPWINRAKDIMIRDFRGNE